ncbi:MAG: hypothetical protein R3D03_07775 [Geminicoccaceae bacterium]
MPNILPLLLLYGSTSPVVVIAEAGAAFLGFGDPDHPSWAECSRTVDFGQVRTAWWWFSWPSIAIITVSALVFVSRAYEEVANPRLRQR